MAFELPEDMLGKVVFFDDSHTYWYEARQLNSAGSLISKVSPEFDADYWLVHGVFKEYFGNEYKDHYSSLKGFKPDPNELFTPFFEKIPGPVFHQMRKALKDQWLLNNTLSTTFGTRFHLEREMDATLNAFVINPFDGKKYVLMGQDMKTTRYDNESLSLNLYDLPDGAYSELLVFNLDWGIAGQADEVFITTKRKYRYVSIHDFKTNQKISKSSPNFLLEPVSHMRDCKHAKYNLQLSIYGKLLESHGFKVDKLAYSHYKDYDVNQVKIEELPYLSREVDDLLKL